MDHGQEVVEVVRHSAGQLSDGLHLLCLAKLLFERLSLIDVHADANHSGRLGSLVTQHSCTSGNPMHGTVRPHGSEFVDEIGPVAEGAFKTVLNRRPILRMNQRKEPVVGRRRLRRRKTKDRHQTVGPFEPIRSQIEFPYTHPRRRQRELCPDLGAAPISDLLLESGGSVPEIVMELRVLVGDTSVRRERDSHILISIAEAVGAQLCCEATDNRRLGSVMQSAPGDTNESADDWLGGRWFRVARRDP